MVAARLSTVLALVVADASNSKCPKSCCCTILRRRCGFIGFVHEQVERARGEEARPSEARGRCSRRRCLPSYTFARGCCSLATQAKQQETVYRVGWIGGKIDRHETRYDDLYEAVSAQYDSKTNGAGCMDSALVATGIGWPRTAKTGWQDQRGPAPSPCRWAGDDEQAYRQPVLGVVGRCMKSIACAFDARAPRGHDKRWAVSVRD